MKRMNSQTGILLIVLISVLVLEAGVRVLKLAPYLPGLRQGHRVADKYLPYRIAPYAEFDYMHAKGLDEFGYKHNAMGFRDGDHDLKKEPGTFRILGLGDSFIYGQGARYTDTFLYRLEKKFADRAGKHPKVEVIKMGMPAFSPEPERILLERYGTRYDPDLIIVGFVPNDIIDTFRGMDSIRLTPEGYLVTKEGAEMGGIAVSLYKHSHLARILLRKYVSFKLTDMQDHSPIKWVDIFKDDGYHEDDWKKVENEYDKMITIAKRRGAKIVFMHIPQAGPWFESHSYPAIRLSRFCRERGVDFIDVMPEFRKAFEKTTLYWDYDGHCNKRGYALMTEIVYGELLKNNLVP